MNITAYQLAERFIGIQELPGEAANNPFVLSMLRLDATWPQVDEVPWCSAFVNYVAWLLRLPRSKSLKARSWLTIGIATPLTAAAQGFDVAVLARGSNGPEADVIDAPGHVGFFSAIDGDVIEILGGNQGNRVCVARFPQSRILSIRRLLDE